MENIKELDKKHVIRGGSVNSNTNPLVFERSRLCNRTPSGRGVKVWQPKVIFSPFILSIKALPFCVGSLGVTHLESQQRQVRRSNSKN